MTYRNLKLRPLKVLLKQALHSRTLKRAALGLGAFAPAFAFANPTGGVVVAGQAGITAPDANHTLINQATQNAIINWQQFSIGSNQFVQFIQPDSSAVVLNRVVGGDPSQILGNLSANGQVFLVNPNGVFFGQGASLDVQGLVATTFDIQDSDFLAGNYVFAKGEGAPDAGVVNQGTLTANNGYLVLAGDYANNDGVIAAQTGQVVLASGKQMALTLANDSLVSFVVDQATLAQYAGVSNTGSIEADGGTVLMTAKVANALTATAVNNSGLITAHSIEDHNGTIILAAQGGDIDESGTLDASGDVDGVAGGNVVIRSNGHTEIASTASINAAGNNANGGFVELSGHHLSVRGEVNLGHGGSLLIDPLHLFITADSSAGGSITSGDYVGAQFIQTQLNLNNDVVLVAASNISAGNPNGVASGPATSINAIGAGNLTLKIGSLAMHTAGASPSDTLTGLISPHCNQGVCTPFSGTPSTGTFFAFTPGNGTINLSGVTISIAGAFTANAGSGDVTLGAVTAQQVSVTAGSITTGNLDATGAAVSQGITLNASHGSYGGPANITTGTLTTTAGNITITQKHFGTTGFAGNSGGNVTASSISAAGALTITATEGSSASSTGGNITLTGLTKAKSITISATAKNGADISAQSLHATGLVSTDNVSLTANANGGSNSSGGNINVSAGIIADHGGVMLNATGGLDAGGAISVSGNISAAGLVSVNATNVGSCCGSVSLANVTGSGIQITANATGAAASVSLGALNATGSSSGITVFLNGGTQPGTLQINGVVKSSHGSVTLDVGAGHLKLGASSAAVYDISAAQNVSLAGHDVFVGNVTAGASGSVVIDAAQSSLLSSNAFIKVASGKVLKGRNIAIGLDNSSNLARGGSISVGDVVATGTSSPYGIVIAGQGGSAQSASQVVNITTGNLTAAAGRINLSDDAGGGALTVNGIIQTAGTVGIFQSGGTAARTLALGVVTGKNITITATEPDPNVTVGALTATGAASTDNVSINLQDFSSAGVVAGFIHVNGAIKSSHGSVILNADGTSLALGASSAAANDIIAAKGVFLNGHDMLLGGISAGGPVNINAKANLPLGAASIAVASGKTIKGKSVYVAINHSSSAAAGGSISVGNVVATGSGGSGSITIGAMNVGHPVNVTTGNLTANTGGINLLGLNGGGSVTVNGAIQTGGVVNMQLSGVGSGQTLGGITVSGAISAGKQVNVFEQGNFTGTNTLNLGNVTAGSDVNVNVTRQNAGSAALTVSNINANTIKINETATSASPATLTLGSLSAINAAGQALVHVFAKGKNDVITTGAITAQGKVANYAGSSSGGSNSFVVSKRTGAAVELFGSGSGSDTITVNGAINIAAQAGNYTVSNTGSHAMTGSGSTGQALLNLFDATPNQGSIKITGNVNMTGAGGVDASLIAGKVTVGGTVTLTAAPVQGKQTLVNTAGGNNLTSSMSATQIGEALFFVRAGSAAGLSASIAGAINVTGPAADVAIKGGSIKLGSVTVTGQGVKQTRSVTGTSQGAAVSFSSSRSAGFGVLTAHATGPARRPR